MAAKGLGCAALIVNGCPADAEPEDCGEAALTPNKNVGVADDTGAGDDRNGKAEEEVGASELVKGLDNGDEVANAPNWKADDVPAKLGSPDDLAVKTADVEAAAVDDPNMKAELEFPAVNEEKGLAGGLGIAPKVSACPAETVPNWPPNAKVAADDDEPGAPAAKEKAGDGDDMALAPNEKVDTGDAVDIKPDWKASTDGAKKVSASSAIESVAIVSNSVSLSANVSVAMVTPFSASERSS